MNFLLHRKIAICMLFIALTGLGYVSYKQLPVELLPNAELPMLFVQVTSTQDMDPSYVESEVVIPLEGAIGTIGGVEQIESQIDSRQSSIKIDFKPNINFKITTLKLQEKMNETASSLPEGFTVQVQKVDVSMLTGGFMSLQVRGSGGTDRVRNLVEKEIRPDLENIDGIASVNIYGGREKAIEVQLDPDACKALDLTPSGISSLLTQNTEEKAFVGYANEPDGKYFVHVNSPYTEVSDLENIVVAPGPVLLKDIATIFFDMKEETSYSRVNGKDAVSVSLLADSQANLIQLSHRTVEVIDHLNEQLAPLDLSIVVENNQAKTMEDNIDQIIHLAIVGGLLAVVILWLFLKNLRLVFFIALSIPISVYTAFNFFYGAGITINSLTLVGMALAIGMLLDNSVVVLENIYRLSAAGGTPERSVTQGTREVCRSILAATLTTVTVFLPFVFSDNFLIKLMGHHIGVSIISTLLISLAVALLFIPMATYTVLRRAPLSPRLTRSRKKAGSLNGFRKWFESVRPHGGRGDKDTVFYEKVSVTQRPVQIYLVLLKTCMRNPGVTIFGAVILLFFCLVLSISLNIQERKEVESDRFSIYVTMPTGSTLENADQVVHVIEERLAGFPEKQDLISRIRETDAELTLVLKEDYRQIGKRSIADIKSDVQTRLRAINGAEISLSEAGGGGSRGESGSGDMMGGVGSFMRLLGIGENRERIVIKGSDFDLMQRVAEDFRYYLDEQEFIRNTRVSYSRRQPEIRLGFDPILLTSYDISRQNIASGLTSLNPEISSGTSFKVGEDTYDIIIRNRTSRTEEEEEAGKNRDRTVDDLREVRIPSASGGLHRLEDIASVNYGRGRARITRVNQDKQIELFYSFSRDVEESKDLLEGYRSDIDQLVSSYNLPSGVAVEVFHEEDMFADFKFLLLAAFILIFMILASVFESLTTPFVLLFSIPLAAIGSLLALLLTGNSLLNNANVMIGFLILLGVVVNNGIILIDYANILRRRGYRRNRALMTAGLSRIRPILITSITTIVAMFPMAMGNSEYAGAIGAPFAITVIGGLSFSALLTLILIPTVCMGLENTLRWYRGLSLKVWVLHGLLFMAGAGCIWLYGGSLLWQSVYGVLLLAGIPGATYFMQASLRRARSKVIDPEADIHISVRNLVKIYDWPGRVSRQWKSGLLIRRRLGLEKSYLIPAGQPDGYPVFIELGWQFALLGFGVWFTWFFVGNRLWVFFLSFVVYAATLYLWRKVREYLYVRFEGSRVVKYANRIIFWSLPPLILFALFRRLDNPNLVGTVGVLWAFCIAVYVTSGYLYEKEINIERVKGRFAGLRRSWFRLVKSIPLIGKRRRPFKALRGVSFEIRTGMFGLLGPNGAGKSTLMRIICGILEQSYGSIWINGLDTRIYREELQSLIGFLPQEFGTYENMSSWEFLDYQAILKGLVDPGLRRERLEYVLRAVHMFDRKDEKIGSFSGGMKQRIGIALILLHLPRILVVDEPTAGLDPRERIRFRNLLVELSKDRIVIFSTHIIEDISSSCSQVAVINKGSLKYFGDPVDMVGMAAGKVWQFDIDKTEFEQALDKSRIVNHIQKDDRIRVRYLSVTSPHDEAVQVEPNLEDAYLCLLKGI
ncbi:efflux RND transporter permease subunit [Parabacteroides johnsonii]